MAEGNPNLVASGVPVIIAKIPKRAHTNPRMFPTIEILVEYNTESQILHFPKDTPSAETVEVLNNLFIFYNIDKW